MNLDPIDILVLKELSADGRASLREIAKRTSLSTPTVSSRLERMMHAGLIKKFAPVFSNDAVENPGILAIITLRAPASKTDQTAKELSKMAEVYGVYVTTGQNNILLRVTLRSAKALSEFLGRPFFRNHDVQVVGSQVVTETLKEEYPLPFAGAFQMNLKCDLCKGEINSSKPYTIKVASTRYYFCCKTCKAAYLEKHAPRIMKINKETEKLENDLPLHS